MTWNQYRGNNLKQGHSWKENIQGPILIEGENESLVELWKRTGPTFAGFVSSPVITSNGVAIIGDLDSRMYAVQVASGNLLWSTPQPLGEYLSSSASLSDNEDIFYVSAFMMTANKAIFYGIGTLNGTILFSETISGMPSGSTTSAFSSFAFYYME